MPAHLHTFSFCILASSPFSSRSPFGHYVSSCCAHFRLAPDHAAPPSLRLCLSSSSSAIQLGRSSIALQLRDLGAKTSELFVVQSAPHDYSGIELQQRMNSELRLFASRRRRERNPYESCQSSTILMAIFIVGHYCRGASCDASCLRGACAHAFLRRLLSSLNSHRQ